MIRGQCRTRMITNIDWVGEALDIEYVSPGVCLRIRLVIDYDVLSVVGEPTLVSIARICIR